MKKFISFIPLFLLFTILSFSQTFVSTVPENRKVVLEEFTGIHCTFCPDGHVIAQGLHDANPNNVFIINIHAGGYASPNSGEPDFRTPFGAAIDGQSGLAGYPAGTVNRHNFPGLEQGSSGSTAMGRSNWATAAAQTLTETSPVNVATQASVDLSTRLITVDVEVYYTGSQSISSNFLNVAIIQNNVPGPQTGAASFNPGAIIPGPWNPTYNHQHMFRHFLTGQWGEEITNITTNTFVPITYTWSAPLDINGVELDLVNLDVVAFLTEGNQEILSGNQSVIAPVFPNQYDVNVIGLIANDVICGSSTDLEMTFRNYGSLNLNSLDIDYTVNGTAGATYNWTGNMLPGETEVVSISGVSFTPQAINTVNFIVSNPNGQVDQNSINDTISTSFIHMDQNNMVTGGISAGNISVQITTDGYGSETSWEILDELGNVIGSGGQGGSYQSNSTYSSSVNVNANECYSFNLYDAYGDGMCCSYGTGASVVVTDPLGVTIVSLSGMQLSNFNELLEYFSTIAPVYGCTDSLASNYDPLANIDDGSCQYAIYGCTDSLAANYDPIADTDDGSCVYCDLLTSYSNIFPSDSITCDGVSIISATSSYPIISYSWVDLQDSLISSSNFTTNLCNDIYFVSVVDGLACLSLDTLIFGSIYGCNDSSAFNYFWGATINDGSCIATIYGCTDPLAFNYDSIANTDDGSCISMIYGCIDSIAYNYDLSANTDDGSCLYCDLSNSMIVSQNSPGNCDGFILANASSSNTPITYLWSNGGTQNNILGLCSGLYTVTITDNVGCIIQDTVAIGTVSGCTDPLALNFNSFANSDDGSCLYCDLTNSMITASNTTGNCDGFIIANSYSSYTPISYLWSTGSTQNNITNLCSGIYSITITDDVGCIIEDTVYMNVTLGCMDPLALNYDPNATIDDGSCQYQSNCTSPKPDGLYSFDVIDTRAKISWNNMNDANCMVLKYFVRYREVGTNSWNTKSAGVGNGLCVFGLNTVTKQLLNLSPSTTYEFKMKAFYCGGTSSNYSPSVQFTTSDVCPDMTNLSVQTFNNNTSKAKFTWDTTGAYVFARITLRIDTAGANWQTAGGFGIYYPTLFVNKFGLQSGESYRAQGRTFCDSNITAYRSPTWTSPIFWTQPGSIKLDGGVSINNLDIYPNPSRDVFNISFNSDEQQDLSIRILSVVGAEVYRETKEQFIGTYTKQISLEDYGKGIYFLEIETNDGVINKKLILQ